MSDKKASPIVFRPKWTFEAGTPEHTLYNYFESFGYGKKILVTEALLNYFYPDLAYQLGQLTTEEQQALVRRQILNLETRLEYFKKLLGDLSVLKPPLVVETNFVTSDSSKAITVKRVEDEDEDEDEYLYEDDGI